MSKVDWSLAPEGATHRNRTGKFFKFDVIGSMGIAHNYSDGKWRSIGYRLEDYSEPGELTERPKHKQWSGPQDGLPPVGIQVEIRNTKNRDCSPGSEDLFGKSVAVMASFRNMHDYEIVAVEGDDGGCYCFRADMCFPVRSTEQLAAEQRETAIREIMDIVGIDCRVTASKAVDAGFKREVV